MASDGPWDPDPDPELPPPSPFDRASVPPVAEAVVAPVPAAVVASVAVPGPARRGRTALLVLLGVLIGFIAGLIAADHVTLPGGVGRDPSAVEAEGDAGLVTLLELITRTEGEMLAFNEAVGDRISEADTEEVALAAIASAAAGAAERLVGLRPDLVEQDGLASIVAVRTAYLPHLDSWIGYLSALAERPEMLFTQDEQQPYLLAINATAADFSDALEDLLATDPAPGVVELAERILDDGFRGMGSDAQV